jgi:antitoxin component YwqK of YwqJK toxin-antitoxin module
MQRVLSTELKYGEQDGLTYYDDDLFTGVGYTLHADGTLQDESEYREGSLHGVSRVWNSSGGLVEEAHWRFGIFDGSVRTWHDNGRLAKEEQYEQGILLSRKEWDENGTLTREFQLSESDPAYKALLRARELTGEGTKADKRKN